MPRILIVEDEPAIADVLRDDLELEGSEVTTVGDGEAATAAVASSPFDLVILDVMLPGKDGFEVCREMRRAGQPMPIIMLTAKTQESDKVMGLEIGADDYVTKPFSPRELRARVKAALRRASGETPEIYRFGQVEVDFGRRELGAPARPSR
jgi:DNA-binding response OmpR family regulator